MPRKSQNRYQVPYVGEPIPTLGSARLRDSSRFCRSCCRSPSSVDPSSCCCESSRGQHTCQHHRGHQAEDREAAITAAITTAGAEFERRFGDRLKETETLLQRISTSTGVGLYVVDSALEMMTAAFKDLATTISDHLDLPTAAAPTISACPAVAAMYLDSLTPPRDKSSGEAQ